MKIIRRISIVLTALGALAMTKLAFAACPPLQLFNPLDPNCTGGASFVSVANSIAGFLFYDIATPLCGIMVLVGAFQMMTSAGDPEKFSQGKKTLTYAAIGFAITLIAGGVTSIIKSVITGH
jgi:hypothetical protein